MRVSFIAALSFVALLSLAHAGEAPERKVEGNTITSLRDPEVRVQMPSSAHYIGADRWPLYDIADCELHVWVEADEQKKVQRLYWVQFEQYLPNKPDLHHTYDSPRHLAIGGMDFYVDTWTRNVDEKSKPGSDGEHVRALIDRAGYKLPTDTMSVRLVHLLDNEKRKELMIIYAEDLQPTGHTAADLRKDGSAYDRWPEVEQGLIQRAKTAIRLTQ